MKQATIKNNGNGGNMVEVISETKSYPYIVGDGEFRFRAVRESNVITIYRSDDELDVVEARHYVSCEKQAARFVYQALGMLEDWAESGQDYAERREIGARYLAPLR